MKPKPASFDSLLVVEETLVGVVSISKRLSDSEQSNSNSMTHEWIHIPPTSRPDVSFLQRVLTHPRAVARSTGFRGYVRFSLNETRYNPKTPGNKWSRRLHVFFTLIYAGLPLTVSILVFIENVNSFSALILVYYVAVGIPTIGFLHAVKVDPNRSRIYFLAFLVVLFNYLPLLFAISYLFYRASLPIGLVSYLVLVVYLHVKSRTESVPISLPIWFITVICYPVILAQFTSLFVLIGWIRDSFTQPFQPLHKDRCSPNA